MANFGIGLGAFAAGLGSGLRSGAQLGTMIRDMKDRKEIRKEFEKARPEYDAAIADDVLTQAGQQHAQQQDQAAAQQPGTDVRTANQASPQPAATDQPGLGFDVDKANRKAKDTVGSFSDFTYSTVMPRIVNKYLEQGNLEAAERLSKWAEDKKERKQTERFGEALNAFHAGMSSGNYEDFGNAATKLLSHGNYGMTAKDFEIIKDGDGNQTGMRFNLERDGKQFQHTFNSMAEASEFLAGQASPERRAQNYYANQEAASKFKSQVALEEAKSKIGLGADIVKENVKAGHKLTELDARNRNQLQQIAAEKNVDVSKIQQEAEYTMGLLANNGYSGDEISDLLPAILRIGQNRKGASPSERVRLTRQELLRSDPNFAEMDPDDQDAMIRRIVKADELIAKSISGNRSAPQNQPGLGGNNNLNILY